MNRAQETVQKMNSLIAIFKSVMPDASDDEIATVAHDISDFWELSQEHQQRMSDLTQLDGTKDRQRLADIFNDLVYGSIAELKYHIESMDATLPKIIKKLESQP